MLQPKPRKNTIQSFLSNHAINFIQSFYLSTNWHLNNCYTREVQLEHSFRATVRLSSNLSMLCCFFLPGIVVATVHKAVLFPTLWTPGWWPSLTHSITFPSTHTKKQDICILRLSVSVLLPFNFSLKPLHLFSTTCLPCLILVFFWTVELLLLFACLSLNLNMVFKNLTCKLMSVVIQMIFLGSN